MRFIDKISLFMTVILAASVLWAAQPAFAQDDEADQDLPELSEHFEAENSTISFSYPADWTVEEAQNGSVTVINNAENTASEVGELLPGMVILAMEPPVSLTEIGLTADEAPDAALVAFLELLNTTGEVVPFETPEVTAFQVELAPGVLAPSGATIYTLGHEGGTVFTAATYADDDAQATRPIVEAILATVEVAIIEVEVVEETSEPIATEPREALELDDEFITQDGTLTVALPESWAATDELGSLYIVSSNDALADTELTPGEVVIIVSPLAQVQNSNDIPDTNDPVEALRAFIEGRIESEDFETSTEPEIYDMMDYPAAIAFAEGPALANETGTLLAFETENGLIFTIIFTGDPFEIDEATISALLDTMLYDPEAAESTN